jgi:hypothetical protein
MPRRKVVKKTKEELDLATPLLSQEEEYAPAVASVEPVASVVEPVASVVEPVASVVEPVASAPSSVQVEPDVVDDISVVVVPVAEIESPTSQQISDMRLMLQMRQTIDEQTLMMRRMSAQLETLQSEVEPEEPSVEEPSVEEPDMTWPEEKEEEKEEEKDEEYNPLQNRREAKPRSYKDMYASDKEIFSENITLSDASSGRWGAMPHKETRVGMRTRSLCLNPTLQQPSIGGLM